MREVTKSTDLKMKNANMKRMYNNEFKDARKLFFLHFNLIFILEAKH